MKGRFFAACVLVLLGLSACTSHNSSPLPSSSTPVVSPTPGPPSHPLSAHDMTSVEHVLHSYLAALAAPNSIATLRTRSADSTAAIHAWIGWQLSEPVGATQQGKLMIAVLGDGTRSGDVATVNLQASIRYPYASDALGGPAQVELTSGGWKVLDYTFDGRSQAAAVFTNVRGSQVVAGVAVDVIGVVLQSDSIDVFARVDNSGTDQIDLQQTDSIVAPGGTELPGVTPYAMTPVLAHTTLPLDFLLLGRSLPPTTTGFGLKLQFATNPGFATLTYDLEVTLAR